MSARTSKAAGSFLPLLFYLQKKEVNMRRNDRKWMSVPGGYFITFPNGFPNGWTDVGRRQADTKDLTYSSKVLRVLGPNLTDACSFGFINSCSCLDFLLTISYYCLAPQKLSFSCKCWQEKRSGDRRLVSVQQPSDLVAGINNSWTWRRQPALDNPNTFKLLTHGFSFSFAL